MASEELWSDLACETERLVVRPLGQADASALAALTNHPLVAPLISFLPHPFEERDARALIARNAPGARERFLGIFQRDALGGPTGRELLGVIGAHAYVHAPHDGAAAIEIGYWLDAGARGRGYAREAARGLIAHLSVRAPEVAIVAEVTPANEASVRLLRDLGFVETGRAGMRPGRGLMVLPGEGR